MLPPEITRPEPAPQSTYRYNLEVVCPPDMHQKYLPGIVNLAQVSGKEDAVTLAQNTEKLEHHWLKAMAITNDARKLYYKPQGSTCSNLFSFEVSLVDASTERADEALVPVTPAVQIGKRLGFPTKGYFYHFYQGKLIQEFKINEGTCSFAVTSSYADTLSDDIKINKLQRHILLYWRLHGDVVANQYVLYKEEKLTLEELQQAKTGSWLDEHGLRIELAAIFAAKSESIVSGEFSALPRQTPQKYQRSENAAYNCPSTLNLGTGMKPVTESSIDPQLPLINVKEMPCCPDCGKIGECKVNIDYDFIKEREGTTLQGYVPDPANSESGVTISSGFDFGCRNILDLKRLELDEALIEKLKPYLGKKRYDALTFLKNCPLEISPSQSTQLYQRVKKESTRRLIQRYNQDSLVKFKCLPKEAQTVIASVYYQFGNKIWNYNFGEHILHQNWQATYDELMHLGCEYPSRRKKEALIIKRIL
ncbi:pesticin C-terminus-like muramidase [Halodesulfovibrio aestuarii]|uniref:Pesticin C-terminus-like muramidase n=1 Tax=Halodesulfovibrio aestuarii TaxID=126333 RepID=A0ABV4JZ84_9BACT